MKKALAIVLALVMALSMATVAFAADTQGNAKCAYCGSTLADGETIESHYKICPALNATGDEDAKYYEGQGDDTLHILADLSASDILAKIVDIAKSNFAQWDEIEAVVIRIVDFLENIGTALAAQIDVNGAVSELEAKLSGLNIPTLKDLLTCLKQKIKDLYSNATNVPEEVEETTAEEAPADTGSASVGIAAFAAISVAAAAAFVCTRKKED
ncbi:MAG: acid shock protein [Clostridia bacterium]|nr:acid shock protein [Clostridia bacterium]